MQAESLTLQLYSSTHGLLLALNKQHRNNPHIHLYSCGAFFKIVSCIQDNRTLQEDCDALGLRNYTIHHSQKHLMVETDLCIAHPVSWTALSSLHGWDLTIYLSLSTIAIKEEEMKGQLLFYINGFMIDSLDFLWQRQNRMSKPAYALLKESAMLIWRKLVKIS